MKKYLMMLLLLGALCPVSAQETISVEDIQLPQGDKAMLVVGMNFNAEHDYVSYQFTVSLPEGVTLDADQYGKAAYTLPDNQPSALFTVDFPVSSSIFKCYSSPSTVIAAHTGPLVSIPIVADKSLPIGTKLTGHLTGIVFSHADAVAAHFDNVEFNIEITEKMAILDENATTLPSDAEDVKVCVRRTIKANQWSTICLPFAMTEAQTKAAFGNDVQIADFNDYEYDEVADAINLKFKSASEMEANHPYMIKVSSPITEFTVDNVDIDPQEAIVDFDTSRRKNKPRQFVGTYVAGTVLDWGMLFTSENRFWYSTGNTKMKAFRGYFNFNDLLFDFADNYESRIAMLFDDEATSIESHRLPTTDNGSYYTLDGRRVKETSLQPGVYVKNGQKVVVR